jgi:MoaA/NifB/PqqE/SkfB family radical SAM enzyme
LTSVEPVAALRARARRRAEREYRRELYDRPLELGPPQVMYLDPATVCNLRCPICPTGNGTLRIAKTAMKLPEFEAVLEQIPETVRLIELYNWGESLLNPIILEMIERLKARQIELRVDTNLSFEKPDDFFEQLVRSGLDEIRVSADGLSQDVYEKFRVGGKIDLVQANLRTLVRFKRQLGVSHPRVIWKYIVNRHSEPEVEDARRLAGEIGVEFATSPIGLGEYLPEPDVDLRWDDDAKREAWLPRDQAWWRPFYREQTELPINPTPCDWLFEKPVVAASRKVLPCCYVSDEKWAFGDLATQSFDEIWNGPAYRSARALFSNEARAGDAPVPTICDHCEAFRKVER